MIEIKNKLNFESIEEYIEDNYEDEEFQKEKVKNEEAKQKHRLKYGKNAKDSFRIIKDILIE